MAEYDFLKLSGKNFLITGAASGIGRATALMLSKLGARLVLLDIDEKGLQETLKDCQPADITVAVDLRDSARLKEAVQEAVKKIGKLNGFAHIAGRPCIVPLKAVSDQMCEDVLKINTLPALELSKIYNSNLVRAPEGGSVVFISSVYGLVGSAANVVYAMSKSALLGITKSLAMELAPRGIRVNCVAPGFVKTKMGQDTQHLFSEEHDDVVAKLHPLGLGEPDDIASAVVFLLSDAAKWMTGAVMSVDGGFTAQ